MSSDFELFFEKVQKLYTNSYNDSEFFSGTRFDSEMELEDISEAVLQSNIQSGIESVYYISGMVSNKDIILNNLLEESGQQYKNIIDKCDSKYFKIFMKGYLDTCRHTIRLHNSDLKLYLSDYNRKYVNYPYHDCGEYIILTGINIADFLGEIYTIEELSRLFPTVTCTFFKSSPNAVTPSKTRLSDAGYDLTIISEYKKLNSVTTLYDTGIKVSIEPHFYIEVVPRSSLSKSGYMMANSMGIIDCSYRGNIYVALTKVDPEAKPIEFPFKCCQIIPRAQYQVIFKESTSELPDTHRSDGGFGSTGN